MGFAASQARFLSLTARLSDNEYEAQQISQERLALNNQMEQYSNEYEAAITNTVTLASVFQNNGANQATVTLSYDVITGDYMNGGLGMNLVTASGLIVVPSEQQMMSQIAASGEELTIADFYIFEDVSDTSILQKNLEEGNFYLSSGKNDQTGEWDKKSAESLSTVTTTYDTTDDAAAKATYDKRMNAAEAKDSMLELRLNQLETSHNAIQTEMDSVQNIIDKNIENSFQTFG